MKEISRRPRRRTVRYVILFTPDEFDLMKILAAREYRALPDFLRVRIYERAAELGLADRAPQSRVPAPVVQTGGNHEG